VVGSLARLHAPSSDRTDTRSRTRTVPPSMTRAITSSRTPTPPPGELARLHFHDYVLYLMQTEQPKS